MCPIGLDLRFECKDSKCEQNRVATVKVVGCMNACAVRAGIIFVVTHQFCFRGSRRSTKVVGASRRFHPLISFFFSFFFLPALI